MIRVAEDFSKYPAGRYLTDGPFPGEALRNMIRAALEKSETVTIVLDGTAGYGSGFLEEAFGGLVREGFRSEILHERLALVYEDPDLLEEIWSYIDDAGVRENHGARLGGQRDRSLP